MLLKLLKLCLLTAMSQVDCHKGTLIGHGSFGEVYKILHADKDIAYKKITFDPSEKENYYLESNINKYRKKIIHENIVRYFCAIKKSTHIYIFMEYISGVSFCNFF